jgi:hypothetical protein
LHVPACDRHEPKLSRHGGRIRKCLSYNKILALRRRVKGGLTGETALCYWLIHL